MTSFFLALQPQKRSALCRVPTILGAILCIYMIPGQPNSRLPALLCYITPYTRTPPLAIGRISRLSNPSGDLTTSKARRNTDAPDTSRVITTLGAADQTEP